MRRRLLAAAGFAASILAAGQTCAQSGQSVFLGSVLPYDYDRGRNVGVLERDRPEYQADGISVGSFDLFPQVETGVGYLDNVFGVRTNKESDGYLLVDPSLLLRSGWSRHQVTVSAGAEFREFFSHDAEDEEGVYAQVDGRLDVNSDNAICSGASVRRSYEERSFGGYPTGAASPVEYVQSAVYARAVHEGGRVKLLGGGDVNHFEFSDVSALGGGTIFQGDRDRTAYRASGRVEYGLTPDAAILGQATFTSTGYDEALSFGLPNRDSDEYEVLGGASFDLTALLRGEIGLGYVSREYDSAVYASLSGFAADASIQYFPTQLTTLSLSGRRLVEDSYFVGSGGYFNNGVNLRVDHELLYNLLLNAQVDYERDDFDHVDRTDEILSVGVGARYLLSRRVGLGAAASYTNRDSSGRLAGLVFDETRLTLTLVFQR